MITVTVKLYGTLPRRYPNYDDDKGLTITLEQGARVADLTRKLHINAEDTGVIAIEGRVARPHEPLCDGALVRIFQVAHGG
jgi:sulfur carrier protein ThiS